VDAVLQGFSTTAGPAPLAEVRGAIDRLFAHDTVEGIVAALQADGSTFATETLATLQHKSPFSLKLTLRQIREGRQLSFDDCMRMEWRMAS
ncbi:enoyl-CoA hydratase/isomerase family protein, partial [Vibrio parahaemolyticus]